jgi:acetyl esterase/lipase
MLRKMILSALLIQMAPFFCSKMNKQTVIKLYEGPIPNSKPFPNEENARYEGKGILIVSKVSIPTLTVFLPPKEKASGIAVIICPGGGYTNLAMGYEGTEVAQRFNESGIAAFVLKYRIPNDQTMVRKEIGPLQDAQRAIMLLRTRAKEWGINPKRIGIMGFSAGGHLAATAGTHFGKQEIPNPDHISLRPDFMVLAYPVISFSAGLAHTGSENNLLGKNPSPEKINAWSNEMQVTDQTPPAFLVHAKDDDAVPYQNSTVFADSLGKHHIPSEIFLYEKGGHGFGMTNNTDPRLWMDHCIEWIELLYKVPG